MARTVSSVKVSCKLNNGTSASGAIKTVSVGIGTLSVSGYDQSKAYAVALALSYCLNKTLVSVYELQSATLTN